MNPQIVPLLARGIKKRYNQRQGLKIIVEDEKLQIWQDGLTKIHPLPEKSHGMHTTPFSPVISAYNVPLEKCWSTALAALKEQ